MDRKAFGKRVSAARKAGGMTGEVLAERCHINVTYLRQIEGGTKIPSLPMFTKLCRELNVSPNYLLPELVAGTEAEEAGQFAEFLKEASPAEIRFVSAMIRCLREEKIV